MMIVDAIWARELKEKPIRQGPTTRCHYSQQCTTPVDYLPSNDVGKFWELDPEDDDGFEMLSWSLPKGRKSSQCSGVMRMYYNQKNGCVSGCVSLMSTSLGEHYKHCTVHISRTLGIIEKLQNRVIANYTKKHVFFLRLLPKSRVRRLTALRICT